MTCTQIQPQGILSSGEDFFFKFLPYMGRFLEFMQIVSNEDDLHEMSNSVFWEK